MFSSSIKKLSSTKNLTIIAIFIALRIALSSFYLPVTDSLRIYPSFFLKVIEGAMFGPAVALISGGVADILGFIIHPTGPFFLGYTISSMLGSMIYALFVYNQEITILKLAISKLLVNLLINVGLGSLWSAILFQKGYIYYLTKSIVKNITALPVEIIVLIIAFNLVLPLLIKKGLVKSQKLPIKLF